VQGIVQGLAAMKVQGIVQGLAALEVQGIVQGLAAMEVQAISILQVIKTPIWVLLLLKQIRIAPSPNIKSQIRIAPSPNIKSHVVTMTP
jgi:hypothetical protein